jgi:hypothetical protein
VKEVPAPFGDRELGGAGGRPIRPNGPGEQSPGHRRPKADALGQQAPQTLTYLRRCTPPPGSEPDQSGWFTLVWQRTADGWRVIHNHSS